jgi:hypothetical protein
MATKKVAKKATKKSVKKASTKSSAKVPAKKAAAKKSPAKRSATKKGAKKSSTKYSSSASKQVETEMHEMHEGKLKSGRSGKKVTNPKQAIAIALSEARKKGAKVPPNPNK